MEELKIVTLNCWGLLYISKDIDERMNALARKLAEGDYDIVALQEVFSIGHYDMICEKVKHVLPYSHYFHSGFLGSGCATFSKYPVIDTFFHKYLHNGYFWMFNHGDWYAGKGIGCALIKHPKKTIYFFNTHLHASYSAYNYIECRSLQVYQITQLVKHMTRRGDAVIICGDFNHEPQELGMRVFKELTNMRDTYLIADIKPAECITSSNLNQYNKHDDIPTRIDYIFVNDAFRCNSCDLTFQKIPGTNKNYSDHEGFMATLTFNEGYVGEPVKNETKHEVLSEFLRVMKDGEDISKRITWSRFLLVFVLFLVFNVIPIVAGELFSAVFPSYGTVIGKVVFVTQLSVVVLTVIYLTIIVVIRQINERDFKNIFKEIKIQLNSIDEQRSKKLD